MDSRGSGSERQSGGRGQGAVQADRAEYAGRVAVYKNDVHCVRSDGRGSSTEGDWPTLRGGGREGADGGARVVYWVRGGR
jgi:hypothetical protein